MKVHMYGHDYFAFFGPIRQPLCMAPTIGRPHVVKVAKRWSAVTCKRCLKKRKAATQSGEK